MASGGNAPGDGRERDTADPQRRRHMPDFDKLRLTGATTSRSQDSSPDISRNTSSASVDKAPLHNISRAGTASLGLRLGRSASLKAPRTNTRHAANAHSHAQLSLPLSSSQTRPATSSSRPVYLSNTDTNLTTHHGGKSETHLQSFETREIASDVEPNMQSTVSSPGLLTPVTSPLRMDFDRSDASEPYSSPYLHYTHRQAPKETHLAEVDVDPVSGRKIINHYEIISELGRGVHGKVKLGRNLLDGTYVAIKIVERVSKKRRLGRTDDQETKIKGEIAILKKARHPNIVGLLEVIDDPAKKKVYIVLEHAELGEVEWRTRGEPEICLVEYRRNQRESEGVFENEAEIQHDQHIMETAHRQLERRERASHLGGWSLELGAESDNEPQSPVGGRYAPPSNPLRASFTTTPRDEHPDVTHHSTLFERSDRKERPTPTIDTSTRHPLPSNAMSTADVKAGFDDMDGTMYGAYDTNSPVGDSHSVFDSWASSHDESLESRIPEHFSYVPTMSLAETRRAIRDTVLGLEYLHYQGVVHRDIKPANLLQTKDHNVKISDFGVSYLGKTSGVQNDDPADTEGKHDYDEALELAKTVGTPAFYAPELCRLDMDENDPAPVTNQIDVWAVGVTLYCLIFGRVPFHHDNTFALMRLIAEREVYIPKRRLKAVEYPREPVAGFLSPASYRQMVNCNKRAPHELEYEDVTDDLKDLLLRLLTKDPRKRIKLSDVKHHPWLLSGIHDPKRWLDESDVSNLTQGKKIEISKEDVDVAVVPLNLGDQIRDLASRGMRKLGGALGIGRGSSRRRAKSSAAGTGPSSNASSSSTISQDAQRQERRRQSLRPDEALFASSKMSLVGDHPLSRSVTASPEPRDHSPFFGPDSRPESPIAFEEYSSNNSSRPDVLERGQSATGSIRTIRQSDILSMNPSGAATAPAMPSTPNQSEQVSSGVGSIFAGARRKGLLSLRGKKGDKQHGLPENTFLPLGHADNHVQPSLALSQELAAGHVNAPTSLLEGILTANSAAASPISSRAPSVSSIHDVAPRSSDGPEAISRASSLSSINSRGRLALGGRHQPYQIHPAPVAEGSPSGSPARHTTRPQLDADAVVAKAKEEQLRKLIREEKQNREAAQPVQSPNSLAPCPPSPDDMDFSKYKPQLLPSEDVALPGPSMNQRPSRQTSLIPSESDEQFGSNMSQSASNPSIPSAFSANSSVGTDEMALYGIVSSRKSAAWSDSQSQDTETAGLSAHNQHVYTMEHDDANYSSEEEILEMMPRRKKSPLAARHGLNTSRPTSPPRQFVDLSPKSSDRRLSTNTMMRSTDLDADDTPTGN